MKCSTNLSIELVDFYSVCCFKQGHSSYSGALGLHVIEDYGVIYMLKSLLVHIVAA